MFYDRSLSGLLPTLAFAAVALCFAPGASAFPDEMFDPGAPPSEFPDHSGELFAFGSTFIFSFSEGAAGFVPRARIECSTCKYPVDAASGHAFALSGRVLGQVRGNDGNVIEASKGVYDMDIAITGVQATLLSTVHVGGGFFEQTIKYTANLTGTPPFKAAISGQLELDLSATPLPSPLPVGTTIKLSAQASDTPGLVVVAGPSQTFPPINATSPGFLGQPVAGNVVFQLTETKRVPCHRDPGKCAPPS
jgi:hypothetical protein